MVSNGLSTVHVCKPFVPSAFVYFMTRKRTRKDDTSYHPHRPGGRSTRASRSSTRGAKRGRPPKIRCDKPTDVPSANGSGEEIVAAVLRLQRPLDILACTGQFLSVDASLEDIRRAYHHVSLRIHPDKVPNVAAATSAFQRLQEAYRVAMRDPTARSLMSSSGMWHFVYVTICSHRWCCAPVMYIVASATVICYSCADTASSIGSEVSDIHSFERCDTEDSASSWSLSDDDSQSTTTFQSASVSDEDFMSGVTSESDDGHSETPSVAGMDHDDEGSSDLDDGARYSRESDVPSDKYDEESNGMCSRTMVNCWTL